MLGLEEAECAAAVALGAVERQIGVAHQLVGATSPSVGPTAMPTLVPMIT